MSTCRSRVDLNTSRISSGSWPSWCRSIMILFYLSFKLHDVPYCYSWGDPRDHAWSFISTLHSNQVADSIFCCAFPFYLRKDALKKFWTLKLGSINSLGELINQFIYLCSGSQLADSTSARSTKDHHNVFYRINGLALPPSQEYAPLKASWSHVLAITRIKGLEQPTPKMTWNRGKRNVDLYCANHRDVGHETEECWDLRKEIESLIRQGYLQQYVWGQCQKNYRPYW